MNIHCRGMKAEVVFRDNRGFILPLVLAVIGICSLLVIGYLFVSRVESNSAKTSVDSMKARLLAESSGKAAINDNAFLDALKLLSVGASTAVYGPYSAETGSYSYMGTRLADSGGQAVYRILGTGISSNATAVMAIDVSGLAMFRLGDFSAASVGNLTIKNTGTVNGNIMSDDDSSITVLGTLNGSQSSGDLSTMLAGMEPGVHGTPDPLALTNRTTYSSYSAPPAPIGGVITLADGAKYYVDGPWSIPNGTTVNGNAIIYVTGNITTNGNVSFTGSVVMITEGTIKSSSSDTFANVLFIVGGNVNDHYGMTGAILCFGSYDEYGTMSYNSSVFDTYSSELSTYRYLRVGTYQVVNTVWM